MILVDYREDRKDKKDAQELVRLIKQYGVASDISKLPYGDFAFDGLDSKGPISIGVERKRIHDMLNCIEDNRFNVHQRLGLTTSGLYQEAWLLLEGYWRPHDPGGWLMESTDGCKWWFCKPGGRPVLYSKLRRALFSISRSGVSVMYTRDIRHTAYDVCELYHYYQKRDHSSLITKQKMNIPSFIQKPPLVRRWAEEITDIGPKKAELASKLFKTGERLGNSEVEEWLAIPGVGAKTARQIVKEITGREP